MATVTISPQEPKTHQENVFTLENVQPDNKMIFDTQELNLWYSDAHALKGINLEIREQEVTAIIGPSGCGKSTYLKTLNRMVEMIPGVRTSGVVTYKGRSILDRSMRVEELRTDRKSTRLNSSHVAISYAVFCLKKKKKYIFNCTCSIKNSDA